MQPNSTTQHRAFYPVYNGMSHSLVPLATSMHACYSTFFMCVLLGVFALNRYLPLSWHCLNATWYNIVFIIFHFTFCGIKNAKNMVIERENNGSKPKQKSRWIIRSQLHGLSWTHNHWLREFFGNSNHSYTLPLKNAPNLNAMHFKYAYALLFTTFTFRNILLSITEILAIYRRLSCIFCFGSLAPNKLSIVATLKCWYFVWRDIKNDMQVSVRARARVCVRISRLLNNEHIKDAKYRRNGNNIRPKICCLHCTVMWTNARDALHIRLYTPFSHWIDKVFFLKLKFMQKLVVR